jgi:GntR family transcriptional regulator
MIPFHVDLIAGEPIYEQVAYAAKKAILAGQLRPGDPFPSVRVLSQDLKINPNTAHKVIAQLIAEGLIEAGRPGFGCVVKPLPPSTATERGNLLKKQLEEVVVEAKKLGLDLDEVTRALGSHWDRLNGRPRLRRKG